MDSTMFYPTRRKLKTLGFAACALLTLTFFGAFHHPFEKDFYRDFHYPYDGDIEEAVQELRHNITPNVRPINGYFYRFLRNCSHKCRQVTSLRLVYLVKSAPDNFHQRQAIRNTWGYERRFSDVEIRTVFLLGTVESPTNTSSVQRHLDLEYFKYQDIVQANFTDSYFNNTYKTMMGFQWAVRFCSNSRFYMFVDDDYYVSTKNVLRFIRNPVNYPKYLKIKPRKILDDIRGKVRAPEHRNLKQFDFDLDEQARLYAGYKFHSAPHRHMTSKWYVSLKEYPYHMWPPYITAGAYVLSREALLDMYYASFYTKHFRFDDIYVGLLAWKSKIEPFHCDEFYYYKLQYYPKNYEFVIATHGYGNYEELLTVWTEQRSLGHA